MRFNTLLGIFSVVAMADGVIAILEPGPFMNLIWHNRTGPEAYLFIQGWGACLLASGMMAWGARRLPGSVAHHLFALSFFVYNLAAAMLWLRDAFSRGWTPFSIATFLVLILFALGFGYFRFSNPSSDSTPVHAPA